ncbi:hypothetical protein JRQ81_002248 [Phrynocephalus forsythii]|uniref:Ig-like domain-containing protein n=1 Tax=Phrynocephalus forsythii TaxID=171643 RepID=A0A9Q0XIA5_9SAUR|nr:hypothetical protein JRQ81_002248 [Phrynocephalus forsythii]
MAMFYIFPLVFLLLNASSGILAGSSSFLCESHVAERGKTASITCRSSLDIRNVTVQFCSDSVNIICPKKSEINTYRRKYTSDNGRISLTLNHSAILNINEVKLSDQRNYKFFLEVDNNHGFLTEFLTVVATYTNPHVERHNDTLICTATGGYPESHLYWFENDRTNLTDKSKFVSEQDADGLFSLKSTLSVDSSVREMIYCCTLNNTNSFHESQGSSCITFENTITGKAQLEKTSNSIPIPAIVLVPILVLGTFIILLFLYRKKKGAFLSTVQN